MGGHELVPNKPRGAVLRPHRASCPTLGSHHARSRGWGRRGEWSASEPPRPPEATSRGARFGKGRRLPGGQLAGGFARMLCGRGRGRGDSDRGHSVASGARPGWDRRARC